MKLLTSSFEAKERPNTILTTPNIMTFSRAAIGLDLGRRMLQGSISPKKAAVASIILSATDLEGSLINLADRFPRTRDFLRIWPSRPGRILDVMADKILIGSVVAGGIKQGTIPKTAGMSIALTEAATVVSAIYATYVSGEEPRVSSSGKGSMIARSEATCSYALSAAVRNERLSEALKVAGHIGTVVAVGLGVRSSMNIVQSANGVNRALEA